jgi:hypothetical protein
MFHNNPSFHRCVGVFCNIEPQSRAHCGTPKTYSVFLEKRASALTYKEKTWQQYVHKIVQGDLVCDLVSSR